MTDAREVWIRAVRNPEREGRMFTVPADVYDLLTAALAERERLREELATAYVTLDRAEVLYDDPAYVRVPRSALELNAENAGADTPSFARYLLDTYGTAGTRDTDAAAEMREGCEE